MLSTIEYDLNLHPQQYLRKHWLKKTSHSEAQENPRGPRENKGNQGKHKKSRLVSRRLVFSHTVLCVYTYFYSATDSKHTVEKDNEK